MTIRLCTERLFFVRESLFKIGIKMSDLSWVICQQSVVVAVACLANETHIHLYRVHHEKRTFSEWMLRSRTSVSRDAPYIQGVPG